MTRHVFRLPDLGEGTVSSEIVAWRVNPGDVVAEDQPLVEMSTDKAVVELPSPVSGKVVTLGGEPGDVISVGAELIVFELGEGSASAAPPPARPSAAPSPAPQKPARPAAGSGNGAEAAAGSKRVMASPATRRRAHEAGIDLSTISGTGPGGRIQRSDLDSALAPARAPAQARRDVRPTSGAGATEEVKIIGVRRVIAQRMAESKRNIPHFAYVEEIDITELDALRRHLNDSRGTRPALTYLPFIIAALVRALERFPQCNALHDAERNVVVRHRSVHAGIATQTPDGLKVPVLRNAEQQSVWEMSEEIRRLAEAARTNKATREELTGSTITVTSLGKLGGIVTTPVINSPEVAIIGVNKAVERPVVRNGAIAVRLVMNLSSSFDHRFVDGFDAAAMIQAMKELLEHPATIFMRPS
jgi:2-oxoisovalerate dehydrogenase E2 component (dihydrolipoyl transacylase)